MQVHSHTKARRLRPAGRIGSADAAKRQNTRLEDQARRGATSESWQAGWLDRLKGPRDAPLQKADLGMLPLTGAAMVARKPPPTRARVAAFLRWMLPARRGAQRVGLAGGAAPRLPGRRGGDLWERLDFVECTPPLKVKTTVRLEGRALALATLPTCARSH